MSKDKPEAEKAYRIDALDKYLAHKYPTEFPEGWLQEQARGYDTHGDNTYMTYSDMWRSTDDSPEVDRIHDILEAECGDEFHILSW